MPLSSGARFGPFEVLDKLGEGGMGEVYRAQDTSLARTVAIKVLPAAVGNDPDRRARFEREAQLLATLNHPNVAGIYGVVEIDGGRGLVLEFVDGPTLADLIGQSRVRSGSAGGVTVEHALAIGRQIADALDAAHEKGVVHRDLKPANIKLTADGSVKVLDFGLAKALAPDGGGADAADLANSPTVTSPAALTRQGVILGTAAYMSPEQARGRSVDRRADIWAFGCVLYELLTGRRAFEGDTIADTLGAVVGREPDWSVPPTSVSPLVRRLLLRCLEKDPRRRLRDIGAARVDLTDTIGADTKQPGPAADRPVVRSRGRTAVLASAIVVTVAAAVAVGAWLARRPDAHRPSASVRFAVPPPPGTTFYDTVETVTIALSPDGSLLAFVAMDAAGSRRIWLRPVDSLEARPLSGTENATSVFWSPDSRAIGFFAGDKMKRLNLADGVAASVCDVPTGVGLFASWGTKDQIVFAPIEGQAVRRVAAAGGTPVDVVTPDQSQGESRVLWPWFLPDGERFFYTSHRLNGDAQVMLWTPGRAPDPVVAALSNVQYVDPGYLIFTRDSTLFALPFDGTAGRPTGEASPIGESVSYMYGPGRAVLSASRTGVIALQAHRDLLRLEWLDRKGQALGAISEPGGYLRTRISPDGQRALFDRIQPGNGAFDQYVIDLGRNIETRLTSAPAVEGGGMFLPPDGRSILLMMVRGAPPQIFRMDLTTRAEEPILPQGTLQEAEDVSPDGKLLVYSQRTAQGEFDLLTLPLDGDRKSRPFIEGPFDQYNARISPDGGYLAYESNESGRSEIYVTTFPQAGERVRVSASGGRSPRWSRKGLELFYISAKQELMSVSLRTSPALSVASSSPLFTMKSGAFWRTFDVAPDGRFLAIVIDALSGSQPLTVRTDVMRATSRGAN